MATMRTGNRGEVGIARDWAATGLKPDHVNFVRNLEIAIFTLADRFAGGRSR
jgi:hypothetical protein